MSTAADRVTVLPDAGRDEALKRAGYTADGKPKRRKRRPSSGFDKRGAGYGR